MSSAERSQSATKRNLKAATEEHLSTAQAAQQRAKNALKKRVKTSYWDKYSYHIIIGGFIFIIAVTLLTTLLGKTRKPSLIPVIEDDEIETHNSQDLGYKLGPNSFFQDQTLADAKKIFNNFFSYKQSLSRCTSLEESNILEESYDFREAFPKCTAPIQDQKNCSSSFAVASAGALSDRLCQATGQNVRLSAQQFLSCQEGVEGKECEQGGAIASFLDFAKRKGLVDDKCFPYVGENGVPCDPSIDQCERHFVQDYCVAGGVEGIKRDIINNGPAIGYIPAFRDFLIYKSGIYTLQEGTSKFQGGHAVKIIGWGQTESGQSYWLVENSWGEDWGEKGIARVAIGQEDLFLDQYAFSPTLKVFGGDDEIADRKEDVDQVDL